MEDFRDKIKNYKATPDDKSWEHFETRLNEGNSRLKGYGFFGLLSGLNLLLFAASVYFFYKSQADFNNVQLSHSEKTEIINDELNKANIYAASVKRLNENSKIRIQVLRDSIVLLSKKDEALSSSLSNLTGANNKLKYEFSILKNAYSNLLISNQNSVISENSSSPDNSVKLSIGETASENELPSILNSQHNYFSQIGKHSGALVLTQNREVKILNSNLELGLSLGYTFTKNPTEYIVSNDVRDYESDTSVHLLLRYHIIKTRRINWYIDGGLGYSLYSRSLRQNYNLNNELKYFNDLNRNSLMSYMFSSGIYYSINEKLSAGLFYSVYKSEQESLGLGIRIRM